jgi:hypothetical protein
LTAALKRVRRPGKGPERRRELPSIRRRKLRVRLGQCGAERCPGIARLFAQELAVRMFGLPAARTGCDESVEVGSLDADASPAQTHCRQFSPAIQFLIG